MDRLASSQSQSWQLATPAEVENQVEVVAPSKWEWVTESQKYTYKETSVGSPHYPCLTPGANPELTTRTEIRGREKRKSRAVPRRATWVKWLNGLLFLIWNDQHTREQHKKQNTMPTSVCTFSCHADSRQRNTSAFDHTLSAKPVIFIMENQKQWIIGVIKMCEHFVFSVVDFITRTTEGFF